jgi:hypothetical protein
MKADILPATHRRESDQLRQQIGLVFRGRLYFVIEQVIDRAEPFALTAVNNWGTTGGGRYERAETVFNIKKNDSSHTLVLSDG